MLRDYLIVYNLGTDGFDFVETVHGLANARKRCRELTRETGRSTMAITWKAHVSVNPLPRERVLPDGTPWSERYASEEYRRELLGYNDPTF